MVLIAAVSAGNAGSQDRRDVHDVLAGVEKSYRSAMSYLFEVEIRTEVSLRGGLPRRLRHQSPAGGPAAGQFPLRIARRRRVPDDFQRADHLDLFVTQPASTRRKMLLSANRRRMAIPRRRRTTRSPG